MGGLVSEELPLLLCQALLHRATTRDEIRSGLETHCGGALDQVLQDIDLGSHCLP